MARDPETMVVVELRRQERLKKRDGNFGQAFLNIFVATLPLGVLSDSFHKDDGR